MCAYFRYVLLCVTIVILMELGHAESGENISLTVQFCLPTKLSSTMLQAFFPASLLFSEFEMNRAPDWQDKLAHGDDKEIAQHALLLRCVASEFGTQWGSSSVE